MKTISVFFVLFILTSCGPKSKSPNNSNLLTKVGSNCELTLDLISACVVVDLEGSPSSKSPFSMSLRLRDKAGLGVDLVSPYQLSVEPYMTKMGHGTSSIPKVKKIGFGVFTVEDIEFSMPGPWDLRIQIQDSNGKALDQTHFEVLVL